MFNMLKPCTTLGISQYKFSLVHVSKNKKLISFELELRCLMSHLLLSDDIISFSLLEEQNTQQHGAVWTTDNHLPIASSVVEA